MKYLILYSSFFKKIIICSLTTLNMPQRTSTPPNTSNCPSTPPNTPQRYSTPPNTPPPNTPRRPSTPITFSDVIWTTDIVYY